MRKKGYISICMYTKELIMILDAERNFHAPPTGVLKGGSLQKHESLSKFNCTTKILSKSDLL